MVEKSISNKAIIATIILFASTLFIFQYLLSQLSDNNNYNAYAQSELIGNTSGNNAPNIDIFNLTTGYTIEPVVWNLTAPDSVTFDDNGNLYLGEAGYPFTNIPQVPRILKMEPNGNLSVFVDNKLNSPIVDIAFHDGLIYVSHRGKISTINTTNGQVDDLIIGLNQNGDHPNNQIAFSPDGKRFFFGTGSATNSGVVGGDDFRWYTATPGVPDVPAGDVTLTGQNFETPNLLTAEPNDKATTGAFVPFNTPTKAGQVVKGQLKCTACILSTNLDGTDLKLVGWGLRNPSGLAFNEDGKLFAANHGADERGSRPIANDNDRIYEIKLNETSFYGWPDFLGNAEPVTDAKFQVKNLPPLQFVMQNHPPVEKPLVLLEPVHTAVIQMAFANKSFGFDGEAFVAQIGSHAPPPGTTVGQNVVRVNIDNKTISDFISLKNPTTLFRPTDIEFNKEGTAMYIVDWGNLREPGPGDTIPNSGIVWKVTPITIQKQ
jgi:glucose/arabinose dehydrogenase